ncbi:tetratricopeptide repeat protein, partial [candidate division KSB1 bacterium]
LSSYGTYALVRSAFQHEELSDSLLSVIADMESLDMTGLSPELQEEIRYFRVTSAGRIHGYSKTAAACVDYINDFPFGEYAPEIRYRGAQALIHAGDISTGHRWLSNLREQFFYSDYNDSARTLLADIFIEEKEYDKAIELYQQEIAGLNPDTDKNSLAQLIKKTGSANLLKNDLMQAADNYRLYIILSDSVQDQADGYFMLGDVLERQLNHDDALSAYANAAELMPGAALAVEARSRQAEILFSQEDFEDAQNFYLSLSNEDLSDSLKAEYKYSYLVCLYKRDRMTVGNNERNDFERTFRDLPRIKLNEYRGILRVEEADVLRRLGRFDEAEDKFRDVIDDYPNTHAQQYAEYLLGVALIQKNEPEEGSAYLFQFDRKYPDSPYLHQVYYTYGILLKNMFEDYRGSYLQFSKAVETPEGMHDQETHQNYIEVSERSGFTDAAITAIRTYLKHFPNADDRMAKQIKLGVLLQSEQRHDEAIAHFKSILQQASLEEEHEIQLYIGQSYYEQGLYALAAAEFMRIPIYGTRETQQPYYTTAQYFAALSFEQIGNLTQAIKLLDEVVRFEGASSLRGRQALQNKERIEQIIKQRK